MTIFEDFHRDVYDNHMKWKGFLKNWCDGREIFVREVAFPFRRITKSTYQIHDQLLYFCDPRRKRHPIDVFLTIHEFEQKERFHGRQSRERPVYRTARVRKVVYDLDAEDEKHLKTVHRCAEKLCELHKGEVVVIFSGRKGFHVYTSPPVVRTIPDEDGEDVDLDTHLLRAWQKKTCNIAGVPVKKKQDPYGADVTTFGDLAQVTRLPYTPHPKSGLCAIPLEVSEDGKLPRLEDILLEASRFRPPEPFRWPWMKR